MSSIIRSIRRNPIVAGAVLLASVFLSAPAGAASLSIGFVPQQSPAVLAKRWGPILKHLSAHSDIRLQFKTAPNIPEFESRVARGAYDIAYMNPVHYTVFHEDPGYEAFARRKGARIQGLIVVRKDSALEDLGAL